ncbi:hypothetical protein FRC00_009406, partial [Tulasnella sp. 408]
MAMLIEGQNLFNKNHQLPDELLAEIIRRAASNAELDRETHSLSDPTLFKSLGVYRGVCKRWRSLIDDTPALWAFLSADASSPEVLKRAIKKSKNALVIISFGAGKMKQEQFVNMVAPEMHRCRALWMSGKESSGSARMLQLLFNAPCPNLEELHCYFSPGWTIKTNDTAVDIWRDGVKLPCFNIWALQNNTQRLRVLGFGQLVEWRIGSRLTNLYELELRESELTAGQLLESLTELPLLRSLVVDRPAAISDQDVRLMSTVDLAFLNRMELLNVTASFAHATLSHITPPSLKQFAISVRNFDLPVLPLDDIATHFQRLIFSLLEAQGTVPIPIRIGDNFLAVSLSDHETSREFELSGVNLWSTQNRSRCTQSIVDLTRWWGSVSTPSFSLQWGMVLFPEGPGVMPPEILKPLMDITAVVDIKLGGAVYGVQHLYQRLSYTVRGKDPEIRRWLLPRLVTLEVDGKEDFDINLTRMLRDRYAAIAYPNGDQGAPLPFSMVKLIRRSSRIQPELDYTSEIRSIVGEEHFSFEIKP